MHVNVNEGKRKVEVAQTCPTLATPWTTPYQALAYGIFSSMVLEVPLPSSYITIEIVSRFLYSHQNSSDGR